MLIDSTLDRDPFPTGRHELTKFARCYFLFLNRLADMKEHERTEKHNNGRDSQAGDDASAR